MLALSSTWLGLSGEGRGAAAGAGFVEGWVAEVGGAGLSGVGEDGV